MEIGDCLGDVSIEGWSLSGRLELIEGKTIKQAACGAGAKRVASTPATAGLEYLKEVLGQGEAWAIPVEVALNFLPDQAGDAMSESGEKTEKKETKGPPARLPHPHPNHRLLDAVVYDQSLT